MNGKPKGTIAFGPPYAGGTATFYRVLSQALRVHGWRVFSVAMGLLPNNIYQDEHTVLLAPEATDLKVQISELIQWVYQEQVDIVISSNSNLLPAIPHLPTEVRYISIPHGINRIHYVWNTLFLERLCAIVCISERQVVDLRQRWDVPPAKLVLIPHGIDVNDFKSQRNENMDPFLHIAFVGSIDDLAKGVLWLPDIFNKIAKSGVNFQGHIVGNGNDLNRLQYAMQRRGLTKQVTFHGFVNPKNVPGMLEKMDVLIMPSRYEGLPLTLLEGMAAGCVPVATYIRGVTGMIIEQGVQGILCPMGDTQEFAREVIKLAENPKKLNIMSNAARLRVREKFNLENMVRGYDKLFTRVLSEPAIPITPKPLDQAEYPKELLPNWRHAWKRFLPVQLKILGRTWLCRFFDRIP